MGDSIFRENQQGIGIHGRKVLAFVKELLPSLRPEIRLSSEGEISLQIGTQTLHSDATDVFEKVLDFAEKAALKKKKRVVVILDEGSRRS